MTSQGLTSLFAMEDISVMGIWELLPHLRKFRVSCDTHVTLLALECMLIFLQNFYFPFMKSMVLRS